MTVYRRRVIDDELDELMVGLPAISLEGPKAVGKTATALRRAATAFPLDHSDQVALLVADPGRITRETSPVLIDEWQRHPPVWDAVRRAVDRDGRAGQFLLTGSASPTSPPTHSGAGRIVRLRMRPMSSAERGLDSPSVSLRSMLDGARPQIDGRTDVDVPAYAEEIVGSGLPAIRPLPPRLRRAHLDAYLDQIVDHNFPDQGRQVRYPDRLRRWLRAYAAATSTTASYNSILDAATPGVSDKPAKTTTIGYRDVLTQLWMLDPLSGWLPTDNHFSRLAQAPKHHLTDPALAARLLNADAAKLLRGGATARAPGRHGPLLGALFESLVTLDVRVYSQAAEARVHHLRTRNGDHEVDLIVEGVGGGVVALEVKLSATVTDADVKHLHWLRGQIGDDLVDAAVITTGPYAYRRKDGIAVIPAALLGP